ncbi:hypothetical protein BB561_004551 [Smittium simulii]|uniref:E3 ubiquitin-protein ligase n=1 Tax=Smittium simulii TaxID=133385 RepID=A0A2T9YFN3_9FUNG|nr:hypothetical protein BB561_004551 [Smittium simulii]
MYSADSKSIDHIIFQTLSRELRNAPHKFNYSFTNQTRKQLINLTTWYLLGSDERLSNLVVIDERTGGALRDEKQEKNIELIEYTEVRRGQLCGHVFRRGEGVYRCKTCAIDDTCVLCTRCFHATEHTGHDTSFSINSGTGGCCDCGESEAWKQPLHCRYHATLDVLEANHIEPIIQPNISAGISGYEDSVVPDALLLSIRGAIRAVLEFILLTFATAPIPDNSKIDGVYIFQDFNKMNQILNESNPDQIFAIVLWNDETHSFQDFLDVIQDSLECSLEEAKKMVKRIDRQGRDVIAISRDINKLFSIAGYMKRVSLNVTIRSARDIFREQLAASLLIWLRDLACFKFRALVRICKGNANISIRSEICKQLSNEWEEYQNNPDLSRVINSELKTDSDDNDNCDECVVEPDLPDIFDEYSTLSFGPGPATPISAIKQSEFLPSSLDSLNSFDQNHQSTTANNISNHLYSKNFFIANNNPSQIQPQSHCEVSNSNNNSHLNKRRLSAISAGDQTEINNESSISRTNSNKNTDFQNILDFTKIVDNKKIALSKNNNYKSKNILPKKKDSYINKLFDNKKMEKLWKFKKSLRLDWFLMVDLQLWKEARGGLRELYMATMMLDQEYKMQMSISFGKNYPRLTNAFLTQDQGPEHSVLLFSVQLFTVPTLSVALVREYGFLYTVLRMLKNFFIKPTPKHLRQNGIILCDTESFRNRRYFHIFHDMRYLASALSVPEWIATEKQFLNAYLGFIALFQGMSPNKRMQVSHVEFEDDTWVHAFNVTLQVAKSCRQFADCYNGYLPELALAIRGTLRKLDKVISLLTEENMYFIMQNDPYFKDYHTQIHNFKNVEYLPFQMHERSTLHGLTYNIVKYSISYHPVSFHHPLQWFLANLFRHVEILDDSSIKSIGFKDLSELLLTFNCNKFDNGTLSHESDIVLQELPLLKILDYPIRVVVLMAQIRARMWVRNGFVVRSQAHHYREISLRENTFDQDLFLIQFFLCIWSDSDHILMTLIDRFELYHWFRGQEYNSTTTYQNQETDPLNDLVDEFLSTLIILVTDRVVASGQSSRELSRREIIHGCLEMTSYSDLAKKVPERLAEHPEFDSILLEIATYRPPTSVMDTGMYELKDEYLDCVDLHFIHYNRNQREEAEDLLQSRIFKKNQKLDSSASTNDKTIIFPKQIEITKGPFKKLGLILHSQLSCQILFFSLYNTTMLKRKILPVSIIDQSLYLIMVALHDGSKGLIAKQLGYSKEFGFGGLFSYAIINRYHTGSESSLCLLEMLILIGNKPEFIQWKERIDLILSLFKKSSISVEKAISDFTENFKKLGFISETTNIKHDQDPAKVKKEAAKKLQSKIMEDFAEAQQKFMENYGSILDDLSDEENDNLNRYNVLDLSIDNESEQENTNSLTLTEKNNSSFANINDNKLSQKVEQFEKSSAGSSNLKSPLRYKPHLHLPSGTCIVCQETCDQAKPYGALALLQSTFILRQSPLNSTSHVTEILSNNITQLNNDPTNGSTEIKNAELNSSINDMDKSSLLDDNYQEDGDLKQENDTFMTDDLLYLYRDSDISLGAPSGLNGFPPHYRDHGMFSSTCGHIMHQSCFDRYFRELKLKHQRQPTRNHAESTERQEFLCPLCNTLGNFLLPVLSDDFKNSILSEPELATIDDLNRPKIENWFVAGIDSIFNKLDKLLYQGNKAITLSSNKVTAKKYSGNKSGQSHKNQTLLKSSNLSNLPTFERIDERLSKKNITGTVLESSKNATSLYSLPTGHGQQDKQHNNEQFLETPDSRWLLNSLRESPQWLHEGWFTIRQKMLGNSSNEDTEVDLNEWRMLIPIYLYIFATSPEWRSHINNTHQILQLELSKKRLQDSKSLAEGLNDTDNAVSYSPNSFSNQQIIRNTPYQSQLIHNSQPFIANPIDVTNIDANENVANDIDYNLHPSTNYPLENPNPQNLSIGNNPHGSPLSFSWSQLRTYGSAVSHAIASSPPWPGHSGVTIQNVYRGPIDNNEPSEIQNDNNIFDSSLQKISSVDLSTHIKNEQFEGKERLLNQLYSLISIYKQFFFVLQTVQNDIMNGLPAPNLFSHLLSSDILKSAKHFNSELNSDIGINKTNRLSGLISPKNNINNSTASSELSSNSESMENEISTFQSSSQLARADLNDNNNMYDDQYKRSYSTQEDLESINSTSNNISEIYYSYKNKQHENRQYLNTHDSQYSLNNSDSIPNLPPLNSILANTTQGTYSNFEQPLNSKNNLGYFNDNNKVQVPNMDMIIDTKPPQELPENMINNVFAQTIMCLEVGTRGKAIPKVFDSDDPRKARPSGLWIDCISSTQLSFTFALSKVAKTHYRLMLSDTTSITEYCMLNSYNKADKVNDNTKGKLIADAATSLAMISIKHSVQRSLLNIFDPFRVVLNNDQELKNLGIPYGMDFNKVPKKPFLMKDSFNLLVMLNTSLVETINTSPWYLLRMSFLMEFVKTAISVGDSALGHYVGAKPSIASTSTPFSYIINKKGNLVNTLTNTIIQSDTLNNTIWREDSNTHNLPLKEQFSKIYDSIVLLEPSYPGNIEDLNYHICKFITWVRTMVLPKYSKSSLEVHTNNLINSTPKYSVALLAIKLLIPFMRRAAALFYVLYGVTHPHPKSLDDIEDPNTRDFVNLWQYLRLYLPSAIFAVPEKSSPLYKMISRWVLQLIVFRSAHLSPISVGAGFSMAIPMAMPSIYTLVSLPNRFEILFEKSYKAYCTKCNSIPPDPSLCLLCGRFVCAQSFCCLSNDMGECNLHMQLCGGTTGFYLPVKKCTLLLLNNHNGCFVQAPYLDTHGEVDLGLKRGRPLFLNDTRYEEIRKLVVNHMIPVTVARKIEQTFDIGGWITL